MAENYERGKEGEEEACRYLQMQGFKLLARNWRFAKAELDLVMESPDSLVIVEVKTRSNDSHGAPEEFVSRRQQKHLIRAANRYLELHPTPKEVRFDIVAITLQPRFRLEHIPEAFYP